MGHTWNKEKDEQGYRTCKICGCKKHVVALTEEDKEVTTYLRDGLFSINKEPKCINWEEENNKTID